MSLKEQVMTESQTWYSHAHIYFGGVIVFFWIIPPHHTGQMWSCPNMNTMDEMGNKMQNLCSVK